MDKITRTIITSTILASSIRFENGELVKTDLPEIVVVGKKIEKIEAAKIVAKENPTITDTIVIRGITTEEKLHELPISLFIIAATSYAKSLETTPQETV